MTTRGPLHPTRRHFIQTAAALSAAGLWIPRASAGPAAGFTTGNYALELNGEAAGWLSRVAIAEHLAEEGAKGGVFGLGPFSASHSISETGKLLDWCLSLPRKNAVTMDGAVIFADHDFDAKRRVDFTGGHITSVKFPKLDASAGKKPFAVDFKWQPATVEYSKASGKVAVAGGSKKGAKVLSTNSFRFQGLPGDTDYITSIDLPLITLPSAAPRKGEKVKSALDIGEVTIEFAMRGQDSVYGYVQKVIRDGKLTDNEYLDFGIELLDPTLSKTLATVQLFGCGLRSYKEGTFEANKEENAKFTMKFTVERFDLKFS